MAWEVVIGIETHAQLLTKSKMFSGASTAFGAAPNTQACAVDIALPGVLPVANKGAIELAIRFGLAVQGKINPRSIFARKNYFYPDLPKGYQISQFETPVVAGGSIGFYTGNEFKTVRLTRAHLEEDAGKSLHDAFPDATGIDLNRAGTPLLEIVSEPDIRGAKEAVAYARALHSLVRWIGICDGNMQEGSFRCDANVSVRRTGEPLGTRCEIKNLNSFRFMEKAIEFEVQRQIEILEDSGKVVQETRLYDAQKDETRSMRSKEDAQDYRYFPDPDLLPLIIDESLVAKTKTELPELPAAKRDRYQRELALSPYDAGLLTQSREIAEYFESVIAHEEVGRFDKKQVAKAATNFLGTLSALLNASQLDIESSLVQPPALAGLLAVVLGEGFPASTAKNKVMPQMWDVGGQKIEDLYLKVPKDHPKLSGERTAKIQKELHQLGSSSTSTASITITFQNLWPQENKDELEQVVDSVLAANEKQVADYRAGKEKAFNSLVGQVMKRTQGKANPAQVNEILREKLKS